MNMMEWVICPICNNKTRIKTQIKDMNSLEKVNFFLENQKLKIKYGNDVFNHRLNYTFYSCSNSL